MISESKRLRLDEILVREGLISEDQIKEALLRQKAHGGKFGSQLLYHRYIDEAALVKALALQYDCEGVLLSDMVVPEPVVHLIPSRVALAREVLPFDYDIEHNILKVACQDPQDKSLIDELSFVARGKQVRLYVAAELSLKTAISRHYEGKSISLEDRLTLDIPDEATETGRISTSGIPIENTDHSAARERSVLLVTDEEYAGPMLQSLLERDGFHVEMTNSADDAIEMIGDRSFHAVFIKDTVSGDYLDLIDRLRKISPRTQVRYYESASALLLNQDASGAQDSLLARNLELFTSLLAYRDKLPENHSGAVGGLVDKLCRRLELPEKDRQVIVNAAFLHDLARFYHKPNGDFDQRKMIEASARLLASLNYSPIVIEMLRSMYKDLKGKYTKRLPIEVFGGNIITIVDIFCDYFPAAERLSLDKFEVIKRKYRDLTGKLFLAEVAEAFIAMMKEEILQAQSTARSSQVMILSDEPGPLCPIKLRLENDGFRTVVQPSVEAFMQLYERSRPDIIILSTRSDQAGVAELVADVAKRGIDPKAIPTFLLVRSDNASQLTGLLDSGIEDVMALDDNLDILVTKLRKIDDRLRSDRKKQQTGGGGTGGRLTDMSLIDLLQALGPSRKTCKMTVINATNESQQLVLYLDAGRIIHASLGDLVGPAAVYESIGWVDGTWAVEPLAAKDLPEPNNQLPNDSILMEGCRLLDEKIRAGQVI